MTDITKREEDILKFWDDNDVFRKSVDRRRGDKPFVFFEGPPTANGNPGIHHFVARVFKDLINRYQAMRGRFVLRKGGWDTHGLPVELQVEKELGFKSKKDIDGYGIAAFNHKCRESVWKYKSEWDRFTRRIGYWIDLEDPYITYENAYMETLWNIIAKFHERDLLYQAHRVVPFCTRCGTPLSSHEVAQRYQTVTETSVYLKFKLKPSQKIGGFIADDTTYILAWTTTPWTLPGNIALAVGNDIKYVVAKNGAEHYILAVELAEKVLGTGISIEQEVSGADLVGLSYEPLFDVASLRHSTSYKVYPANFVTVSDGTGVVHTAVMYGEDDYRLGDQLGLVKQHTVTEAGTFVGVSSELDGKYVKSAETEKIILDHLRANNMLLATVPYEHEYPFCWRCDTPLLYYAKDSWFVRMSTISKQLLANNATIDWMPAHLKEGRFGQWLKEAKDWAFSRERYWATPLPIWRSEDKKEILVASSLADLDEYRARKGNRYWLVRHGESEKNIAAVIDSGSQQFALTEKGGEGVAKTATTLKKKLGSSKAIILSSPVLRAQQTAQIIATALGAEIMVDERLGEIRLGPSLEGRPDAEYDELIPTYRDAFTQQPPGGESLADLKARMWELLGELEGKYGDKDIVLVSHEYPIWMLADVANGWSMAESIAEEEKRDDTFIPLAGMEKIVVRNLPRDERGNLDLHRPYIDDIALVKNGKPLRRVPEVADVWFDSGSMPYAQWHWPFENEAIFQQQYPADFICEGIDQTRGWFYTLLAVSTALGDPAPYRAVLSLGHVLDEKGQKMSKSKGNIVKPDDVISEVGVDTTRWYFYTVNDPGDAKNFSMKDVRERLTGFMGTLGNCLRFYELYRAQTNDSGIVADNLLDQWLLSRLHTVTAIATEGFDAYDITKAARAIERFVIDDFSQWWLRRSRKRTDALELLRHTLRSVALLSAPCIPFTAEDIWQKVRTTDDPISIHLADWPIVDSSTIQPTLEGEMERAREYVTAGLACRKTANIKVRQPLASVTVPGKQLHGDLEQLIKDELNVKEIKYAPGEPVVLDADISESLRDEGWAREIIRTVQDMRKEAGCHVVDHIVGAYDTEHEALRHALDVHRVTIQEEAGLAEFQCKPDNRTYALERTFDVAPGVSLWIAIEK